MIDRVTQRCQGCGHPRKEHRGSECTVPRCACVDYRYPSRDEPVVQKAS